MPDSAGYPASWRNKLKCNFCFHQALKQQHASVRHEWMEVLGFGVRRCRHLTIDGVATTSATPNGSGGSASRTTPWTSFRRKTFALFEVNHWTLYWNQMLHSHICILIQSHCFDAFMKREQYHATNSIRLFLPFHHLFRCAVASLKEGVPVHMSVRPSVTPSLRRLLGASYAEYSALFPLLARKRALSCFFVRSIAYKQSYLRVFGEETLSLTSIALHFVLRFVLISPDALTEWLTLDGLQVTTRSAPN